MWRLLFSLFGSIQCASCNGYRAVFTPRLLCYLTLVAAVATVAIVVQLLIVVVVSLFTGSHVHCVSMPWVPYTFLAFHGRLFIYPFLFNWFSNNNWSHRYNLLYRSHNNRVHFVRWTDQANELDGTTDSVQTKETQRVENWNRFMHRRNLPISVRHRQIEMCLFTIFQQSRRRRGLVHAKFERKWGHRGKKQIK